MTSRSHPSPPSIARAAIGLALLFAPSVPAFAQDRALDGPHILSTLRGAEVTGPDWSQSFLDGGATIYTSKGNQSNGRWDVRGDEYCSLWPPSDVWACYAMTISATDDVTWISADGARTTGHLTKKGK